MNAPVSRDERHAALLILGRTLAEADASVSTGDVGSVDAALKRVSKAFDLYWSRHHEDISGSSNSTARADSRRSALRRLAGLLTEIDQSLSVGDLTSVKNSLEAASETVGAVRSLDESSGQSEIRRRASIKRGK